MPPTTSSKSVVVGLLFVPGRTVLDIILGRSPGNLQWKFESESRSPSCTLTQTESTACGTGTTSAIVHVKSSIPVSPNTGMFWEIGGAGAGTIFYLDSVQYIHVSAGAGDAYKTVSDATDTLKQTKS